MKVFGPSRFLGLSLGDRSIFAAELAISRDRVEVKQLAELVFPSDASWEAPEKLGPLLRRLLRQNHFSTSRAIVGVPARWVMAREKLVPPTSAGLAGKTLQLQAERESSLEVKDLVLDYAGAVDPQKAKNVLLVTLLRQHLERVEQVAKAAGIRLLAITSSTLALSSFALVDAPEARIFLSLATEGAEIVFLEDGAPRLLRHLPLKVLSTEDGGEPRSIGVAALSSEVRRAMTQLPKRNGSPSAQALILWDGIGLGSETPGALGERLEVEVQSCERLTARGFPQAQNLQSETKRFGPAVALAFSGARRELLGVDFLHSRCFSPKKIRLGRRAVWAGAAAAALLAVGVFLFLDLEDRAAELGRLNELAGGVPVVQDRVDLHHVPEGVAEKVSFVMGWYEERPPFLECLKQVTLAFPEEGAVWATSFTASENRKGSLSGKAVDQKSILSVLDRLKTNNKLSDVKLSDMREGGTAGEISFALSFTFNGVE